MGCNRSIQVAGFATLTLTLLLLALMLLITLYTARFKVQEQRLVRHHMAILEARLIADTVLERTSLELDKAAFEFPYAAGDSTYAVEAAKEPYHLPPFGDVDKVTLKITGYAKDSAAVQRSALQLLLVPLVRRLPQQAVVLTGKAGQPDDLLDFLFGIPARQWPYLQQLANQQLSSNCDSLDATTMGLIWVTGDCTIRQTQVGTPTAPVVLVVQDGTIRLKNKAKLFGVVVQFSSPASQPNRHRQLKVTGNAQVWGAVLSSVAATKGLRAARIHFQPKLLATLQRSPSLRRAFPITGSWHDF